MSGFLKKEQVSQNTCYKDNEKKRKKPANTEAVERGNNLELKSLVYSVNNVSSFAEQTLN